MNLYEHASGIAFRRIEEADLGDLAALKDDSWATTHRVSIVSGASQRRWLAGLDAEDPNTPRNLVLIASYERKNIGVFNVLGIDWQSRFASVGWSVYREHRGRGFGNMLVVAGVAFCFNVLNMHRLHADILETNDPSLKCAEHAGFVREGVQRELIRRGGKWIDSFVYGIITSETP